MRRTTIKTYYIPYALLERRTILICLLSFFIGALIGLLFSAPLGENGSLLSDYLERVIYAAGTEGSLQVSLPSVLWDVLRWPLFVFLLGFFSFGALCIPLVLLFRGFIFSFAIGSLLSVMTAGGAVAVLILFVLSACFSVPALLALACHEFERAQLAGTGSRGRIAFSSLYFIAALCFFVCIMLEYYAVPALFATFSRMLVG